VLQECINNPPVSSLCCLVQRGETPPVNSEDVRLGLQQRLDLIQIAFFGGVQEVFRRKEFRRSLRKLAIAADRFIGKGYLLKALGCFWVSGILVCSNQRISSNRNFIPKI
jgi:hypothetical protein